MRFDPQSNRIEADAAPVHVNGRPSRGGRLASFLVVLGLLGVGGGAWWVWTQGMSGPRSALGSTAPVSPVSMPDLASGLTAPRITALDLADRPAPNIVDEEPVLDETTIASRDAFDRGRKQQAVGRHREAMPLLAEAIELDPEFAQARYQLGMACALTGDMHAAREQQAALRELDPSLASLLGMLIR